MIDEWQAMIVLLVLLIILALFSLLCVIMVPNERWVTRPERPVIDVEMQEIITPPPEQSLDMQIKNQTKGKDIIPILFSLEQISDLYILCKKSEEHVQRGFTYFEGRQDVKSQYVFNLDLYMVRYFIILKEM